MAVLTVHFTPTNADQFVGLLKEHGVRYREPSFRVDGVYAAGSYVQIVKDGTQWAAIAYLLAKVAVAFMKAKHGRTVHVQDQAGNRIQIEGLTEAEVAPIIEKAVNLIALDPENMLKKAKADSSDPI